MSLILVFSYTPSVVAVDFFLIIFLVALSNTPGMVVVDFRLHVTPIAEGVAICRLHA